MATLEGVYPASVLDNLDPESLGRVLVRVSGATGTSGDSWARVATLAAGRNRGTWFIPEVGDEVLVAFERGDSKTPYVIGTLWNGKARPPAPPEEAATVKLIRSRSGVTLRIRDDGKNNGLVLETPAGQRITLQDTPAWVRVEDASGNAVTVSASGVTVNASATVALTATAVQISASTVTVSAGMSRFNGVVQCNTLMADSVIGAN
jgi:uncharacterized protein involved in type VI secretion and phage assembly